MNRAVITVIEEGKSDGTSSRSFISQDTAERTDRHFFSAPELITGRMKMSTRTNISVINPVMNST